MKLSYKKIYLWLKWHFFDTVPYANTFEAYLWKTRIDEARKQCRQRPLLKEDYMKKKCLHIESITASTLDSFPDPTIRCGICKKKLTEKEIKIFQMSMKIRSKV